MTSLSPGSEIEVVSIDKECVLIRNFLDPMKQETLFQYIEDSDRTPWDTMPRVMIPSPKTLMFGKDMPTLKFKPGENSLVCDIVNATDTILQIQTDSIRPLGHSVSDCDLDLSSLYKLLTMAAIKYEAPDGQFPQHIDHSNSYVYLVSLGCTANFMVKGPEMTDKHIFKFRSGDLLVFNASTKASILHAVNNIDIASCPRNLSDAYPVLHDHRYGIQIRASF